VNNKEKLIKLYNKCSRDKVLKYDGLCTTLRVMRISRRNLRLFKPDANELEIIKRKGYNYIYWASGYKIENGYEIHLPPYKVKYRFTSLRQTILAFLIAMEN